MKISNIKTPIFLAAFLLLGMDASAQEATRAVQKDKSTGYYIIPAGDASALLQALTSANSTGNAVIFLPDGVYDLGKTTGTIISGKNISLIGQSARGVVIKNAPDVADEGLTKADLFRNTSTGLYMQDLTLKNDLDYYNSGSAGRAAALQDCGKNTIAKRVHLVSHQDTYYSHKDGSYFYWEGGEIHGTVDYICGSGNVYFNGVTLVNESRYKDNKTGECTITAASTKDRDKGYVFEGCSIKSNSSTFNFGRSWNTAKTVFLNTTISSGKLIDTRWRTGGINSDPVAYYEYNTIDKSGNGKDTPSTNKLTFTKANTTMETVISAAKAEEFSYERFFSEGWDPRSIALDREFKYSEDQAGQISIEADAVYLVEYGPQFVGLYKGDDLLKNAPDNANGCTIRIANARGGFSRTKAPYPVSTAVEAVGTSKPSDACYNLVGQRVDISYRGIGIRDGRKYLLR